MRALKGLGMQIKRILLAVAGTFAVAISAQALTAADFLAPVQAPSTQEAQALKHVNTPDKVRMTRQQAGETIVTAASAQDSINAAVAQSIESGNECIRIEFPSGFGWVATGTSVYQYHQNPTASLISQRRAYANAYLQAKKNLTATLTGISHQSMTGLMQQAKTLITSEETLANTSDTSFENIGEFVSGLIRGYVVYSVDDQQDADYGTVTVSIVSTPAVMQKHKRSSAKTITAQSIEDGLNSVISEVENGLMAPIGGRTIWVEQTGELAFVGFGSAVCADNANPAVAAKLRLTAKKVGAIRARSALVETMKGARVTSVAKLDDVTREISKEFDEVEKFDIKTGKKTREDVKLDEQVNSFKNTQEYREWMQSVTSGIVPPGVQIKSTFNKDKTMVQSIAVYLPSRTAQTRADYKKMMNAKGAAAHSSVSTQHHAGGKPPQGPSGQVSPDAKL